MAGDGGGPAPTVQASALLRGALDQGRDVSSKARAFSSWKPLGIFEATGKRLIEAD